MSQKAIKLLGGSRPVDKNSAITVSIVVALFAVIEVLKGTGHISNLLSGLLVPICMYITLAVSLNLVVGILGELSLGHAGFMCVGAYASALFSLVTKDAIPMTWLRFLLAFLIGGAVAAVFGLLIGIPVLRLKGDYLAIVTLAFGEIIKNLVTILHLGVDKHGLHFSTESVAALHLQEDGKILIKGALGITGVPKSSTLEIGFVIVMIPLLV